MKRQAKWNVYGVGSIPGECLLLTTESEGMAYLVAMLLAQHGAYTALRVEKA